MPVTEGPGRSYSDTKDNPGWQHLQPVAVQVEFGGIFSRKPSFIFDLLLWSNDLKVNAER